jgi:hypothetical protein
MPSITLKDIPADLHAQLAMEAETNYRSLARKSLRGGNEASTSMSVSPPPRSTG